MQTKSIQNLLPFAGMLAIATIAIGCTPQTPSVPNYSITGVTTDGVDDSGNMYLALQGTLAPSGNAFVVNCDGTNITPTLISESATLAVISMPAATDYADCSFVDDSGGDSTTPYNVSVSALNIASATTDALDPSDNTQVQFELEGSFYATALVNSIISVYYTCDGGATNRNATIISQNSNTTPGAGAIAIDMPNPGAGITKQCEFYVEDDYTEANQNITTITSNGLTTTITGF